ncbi:MAG: EamA family transporter, partial [Pseudomonadota bacterium]
AFDSVASNIGAVTWADALPFILIQGFAVSLASLTFAFAIRRLGPGLVTTIGSLTPVVTAFLAIPILGEPLTVLIGVAIGLICLGVYQATKV